MVGYIRLMTFLSSKCRGSNSCSSSFFPPRSTPHTIIVSLVINAAQFDSVLESLDQN